jgi:hypothetical protein
MRTTVEFDPDTSAAIEELRRSEHVGVSEAVNRLIRRGLLAKPEPHHFEQRTEALGLRIDVSNIAEALDALEGAEYR